MGIYNEMYKARGEAWADEAFFIFTLLVGGGRSARAMERKLEQILAHRTRWPTPRDLEPPSRMLRRWRKLDIIDMKLREIRTGQYARVGRALEWWLENGPDVTDRGLRSPAPLEAIPGIGPKSARFFLLYRREGVRVAVLDRHVLRFLRSIGVAGTPRGYRELEGEVLKVADHLGMSSMVLDDIIWRHYALGEDDGAVADMRFILREFGYTMDSE